MSTERNLIYVRRLNKQKQREREVKRKLFLIVLTIVLIVGLSLSYRAILSKANTDLEDTEYKYYTSIMVKYGDSLWSIAEEHADSQYASTDEYIQEVIKINALKEDAVNAGQFLIVPYFSSEFVGKDI